MTEEELKKLSIEDLSKLTIKSLAITEISALKNNKCPDCGESFNDFYYPKHLNICETLIERKNEYKRLHAEGLSDAEIAKKLGTHRHRIRKIAREFELDSNFVKQTQETINFIRKAVKEGKSFSQISKETGKALSIISSIARKHKIQSPLWTSMRENASRMYSEIIDVYNSGSEPTNKEIQKITGYSEIEVSKTLKKFKLTPWGKTHREEKDKEIYDLYLQGMSYRKIGLELGISRGSVRVSLERKLKSLEQK